MRSRLFSVLFAVSALSSPAAAGAAPASPAATAERWAPLAFLIGDWAGQGSGKPGETKGRFSLTPDLQGHVLLRRNTDDTPNGRHEDLMVIVPAANRGFRAFYADNEDHVIQYTITATESPKEAVFLSDEVPGAPRFRLTYHLNADGSLGIAFAIAPPGSQEFKTSTEGTVRKRQP